MPAKKFKGKRCEKPPGGKRAGAGRKPKPKKLTLLQEIYENIDKRIPRAFQVIDLALEPCIKKGRKKPDPTEEQLTRGVRIALDLIEKRLPKQTDVPMVPITLVIENPIPGVKARKKR